VPKHGQAWFHAHACSQSTLLQHAVVQVYDNKLVGVLLAGEGAFVLAVDTVVSENKVHLKPAFPHTHMSERKCHRARCLCACMLVCGRTCACACDVTACVRARVWP
jgi:hypothetical protein